MSEIKVNKITPRAACGTTQLGDSGDTFTIPSGATITNAGTASGFGATGETSWDTTVKTTGTFTATAGVGYFLNTTGGTITVNLPVGAAGSSVAMVDYAGTWDSNAVTVAPNGSEKIGGIAASATLSTEGQSVTFVYIDGIQGWVNVLDSTSNVIGATYIVATGGTPCSGAIVCTNYKTHTFTGPGTFCVSSVSNCAANNLVSYVVVGAGGGSGNSGGGGGGAGGFREVVSPSAPYTGSPLDGYPSAPNRITVTATGYPIAIGSGGTAGTGVKAPAGGVASFSTITGAGGGGGGGGGQCGATLDAGGSGGGGRANQSNPGGAGNTPSTTPSQGFAGGTGGTGTPGTGGGGGGGASAVGANGGTPGNARDGGNGGAGVTSEITASPVAYAGGGGGGTDTGTPTPGTPGTGGTGGPGGGGAGGIGNSGTGPTTGVAGGCNTGGGAGGGTNAPGASPNTEQGNIGGSGIVIIRYKFQ